MARQRPTIESYVRGRHKITRRHPGPLGIEQHPQRRLSSWQADDQNGDTRVLLVGCRWRRIAIKALGRPSRERCSGRRIEYPDFHRLPVQLQRSGGTVGADSGIGVHAPLHCIRRINLILQQNLPPSVQKADTSLHRGSVKTISASIGQII